MKLAFHVKRPRRNGKLRAKQGLRRWRLDSDNVATPLYPERNDRKAMLREATGMRIRAERKKRVDRYMSLGVYAGRREDVEAMTKPRLEEAAAIEMFKDVPNVEEFYAELRKQSA